MIISNNGLTLPVSKAEYEKYTTDSSEVSAFDKDWFPISSQIVNDISVGGDGSYSITPRYFVTFRVVS